MSLQQTLTVYELLDDAKVSGKDIENLFSSFKDVTVEVQTVEGDKGSTDCVKITIAGVEGKLKGGSAPTLGIIGRLGGIGARPNRIGLVSDGDGAIAAIASALKLAQMKQKGDVLKGDVIITTHVCPNAPTLPHKPVDFMDSPIDMGTMNKYEVLPEMDAILSIDTTKGNRVINHKGIAISPTVKQGYILKVSDDLLRVQEMVTGQLPVTFPITMQDITPYGNDVYHINSILQPATATTAPVVGVAITAQATVPGCGTGASHETDIALAVKYAVEVAKEYSAGVSQFYDEKEFHTLVKLYGSMEVLQTFGQSTK